MRQLKKSQSCQDHPSSDGRWESSRSVVNIGERRLGRDQLGARRHQDVEYAVGRGFDCDFGFFGLDCGDHLSPNDAVTDAFLPRRKPDWEGILMHGVYHYHKALGVDESVAWGDHFFVEALVKALAGKSEAAW